MNFSGFMQGVLEVLETGTCMILMYGFALYFEYEKCCAISQNKGYIRFHISSKLKESSISFLISNNLFCNTIGEM